MLMPPLLNWFKARDLCRRFNGRLHIDNSAKSVRTRSFPLVEKGETFRPQRCRRVWLGASDLEEEGVWRDSETNEVLDLRAFWGPGQPNGVRVQNCAGIWELVILLIIVSFLEWFYIFDRMVKEAVDMMMELVTKNLNVHSVISSSIPELHWEASAGMSGLTFSTLWCLMKGPIYHTLKDLLGQSSNMMKTISSGWW